MNCDDIIDMLRKNEPAPRARGVSHAALKPCLQPAPTADAIYAF